MRAESGFGNVATALFYFIIYEMYRVQQNDYTDYNAPSSETFGLLRRVSAILRAVYL